MKSRSRIGWLILAFVVLLITVLHVQILTAVGSQLVDSERPQKADAILVLAGDPTGLRILTGADLAHRKYAPIVLVSGPNNAYGLHECDLAIPFAVKHGFSESYFVHMENTARSTADEAKAIIPEMRKRGFRRILLVTSNFHTARAARIFRSAAPDLKFIVIAAPNNDFQPNTWWHTRDGEKVFLLEWEKTITSWFGI